jgi:pullulanase/glycogen debranching enzyme
MTAEDWEDPDARALAVALDGRQIEDAEGETTSDRFLLLLNAHDAAVKFTIPSVRAKWEPVLTTGRVEETPKLTARTVTLEARSLLLLHSS